MQDAPSVQQVPFNQFIMVTANVYTHVFSHANGFLPLYHYAILGFDSTLLTMTYYMSLQYRQILLLTL